MLTIVSTRLANLRASRCSLSSMWNTNHIFGGFNKNNLFLFFLFWFCFENESNQIESVLQWMLFEWIIFVEMFDNLEIEKWTKKMHKNFVHTRILICSSINTSKIDVYINYCSIFTSNILFSSFSRFSFRVSFVLRPRWNSECSRFV